jgi:FMN phosphatase YigB (HAD superfamily)
LNHSRHQISAVSFDAYGTLLRLDRPFERLAEELHRMGLDVPMDIVTKVFLKEMLYYREHHLEGNNPENLLNLRHGCADLLFRMLAQEGYSARVSRERQIEVLMGAIRFELYDDALPALDWCKANGLATGVVSNWDCSLTGTLRRLCSHDFACLIVSACEGVEKSDSELFLRAARCFNLPPSGIVHVGDEVENDLHGGEQAGLQAVLLDRENTQSNLPAHRIENLREFPNLFERVFS